MKLGLVGLPRAGKTTIFNALTGLEHDTMGIAPGQIHVEIAVVDVPDPRLETLNDMYNPKKKVPARITYADIGGVEKGISEGGVSGKFRQEISQLDGLIVVVRGFEDDNVHHPEESVDPLRDLETLDAEFLFSDLAGVENRINRLNEEMSKGKNRDQNARELELLERVQATLESDTPLRNMELTPEEEKALRGFQFLSQKKRLVLVNTGETNADLAPILSLGDKGEIIIPIQGEIEMEISQLEPEEAEIFLEEYGIKEPVRDRIIHDSYAMMNIQTFFTVGDDEVRAWPHSIGATAQQAAGVIHSDLERGFIRAEIVHCDTLIELGSMAEVRNVGKLGIEGKTYIMKDGDLMNVRFNV